MSDGITDAEKDDKEKSKYFDATYALSKYIADRAKTRPAGVVREKYLEMAYKETFGIIKKSVVDLIKGERQ